MSDARTLARLNRLISSSLDLTHVLAAIARAAAELTGAPFVAFWVADVKNRVLHLSGVSDPQTAGDFAVPSLLFDQGGVGWVASHGQPLNASDVFTDSRFFLTPWWHTHGFRSFYGVPVSLDDTLLAVLALIGREPFRLDAGDQELVNGFVGQAAVAIRNARLFSESEHGRRTAEALADLGRLLSQTLDIEIVAQRIAENVRRLLGVRSSSVYHLEDATGDLVVMATSSAPSAAFEWALVLPKGTGAAGLAAQLRAPVATPDVLTDPRIVSTPGSLSYIERSDNRAVLAVPFMVQDRVIGALAVGDRAGRTFDEEAIRLAQAFADQAAVALENARLLEEAELRQRVAEEAEARYRRVFERNLAGIVRATVEGTVTECNDAFAHLLGYASHAEVQGLDARTFYADAADRTSLLQRLRAEGIVSNAELRWVRRDGAPITVLVTMRLYPELLTQVLEGFVVDISDRKRLEAAERQAEALRSVARLAYAAAHEINNPLAVIVGRLQLLARRFSSDATLVAQIEQAITAGLRISEMIAHMGRISRLEVADQVPGLEPILDLRKSASSSPQPD
ncbi:MAG TPA: GAF domain-containing protein [Methylomirabilota bacterium]|jgi:PAS domain S-box-containing protein